MAKSLEVIVSNKVGLHARPATLFVKEAARFESKILVENLTNSSPAVNARSLLMILSIGAEQGHSIRITMEGSDEDAALDAMKSLIENNFGEK